MNRERRNRLRAIRDNLRGLSEEVDEILENIEGSKEAAVQFAKDVTGENWSSADEELTKDGIFFKDLKEGVISDQVIIGQIKNIFDTKTFERKDKSQGAVKNIVLSDSSGDILVVFWDDTIEKISEFLLGEHIEITNAWQIKRNQKGVLELHPGKFFNVKRVE